MDSGDLPQAATRPSVRSQDGARINFRRGLPPAMGHCAAPEIHDRTPRAVASLPIALQALLGIILPPLVVDACEHPYRLWISLPFRVLSGRQTHQPVYL